MRRQKATRTGTRQRHEVGAPKGALNLIHRNNCSNPASMRVTARFEPSEGLPVQLLTNGATAVAWMMGWRAAHAAKSTT